MNGVTVLAVDPGKASGVAVLHWSGEKLENPQVIFSTESSPEQYASDIAQWLEGWKDHEDFKVCCERFTITAQTVRNSQAPYSLEQIGVLKHLCREYEFSVDNIVFQAPVDAKTMFSNEVLKSLGTWHRGGAGHANDAIRHGLLAMIRSRWVPKPL